MRFYEGKDRKSNEMFEALLKFFAVFGAEPAAKRRNLVAAGVSHEPAKESVGKRRFSLCLCENLRVSVVKLLKKTLTTEAQRLHRGTEINFSDRLRSGRQVLR